LKQEEERKTVSSTIIGSQGERSLFSINEFQSYFDFRRVNFCVTLLGMGSKDKGKKEAKKAPKPKPKPEPGRKREGFTPAPPK
jgi:hypothetical protein